MLRVSRASKWHGEDGEGLRLLSLDGGGIRAISQLLILRRLMDLIDPENPPRPCEIFDLICGSGIGGLLAIMLGRLRMSVEGCIEAIRQLAPDIYQKESKYRPISLQGNAIARSSAEVLTAAMKKLIKQNGLDENEVLKDKKEAVLPVTVVLVTRMTDSATVMLSSHADADESHSGNVKIWEAARATSAAPKFFEPVTIGPDRLKYADGGLVANNPVQHTMLAAERIWPEKAVRCLVSLGSGRRDITPALNRDIAGLLRHAASSALNAQHIAESFAQLHKDMVIENRYYRFSAPSDLGDISLDEWKRMDQIISSMRRYFSEIEIQSRLERSAESLTRYSRPQRGDLPLPSNVDTSPRPEALSGEAVSDNSKESSIHQEDIVDVDQGIDQKVRVDDPSALVRSKSDKLLKTCSGFLAESVEIKALLVAGRGKISSRRLERNFSILVEDFAERLALADSMHELSQFIGARSLDTTQLIFTRLPANKTEISTNPPSYEEVESAAVQIQDLAETQRKFHSLDKLQLYEAALQSSRIHSQGLAARDRLIQDLRRFVFPSTKSYIREVLLRNLPVTIYAPIHSVAVRVSWELPSFLAEEFDPDDDISSILTITGGISSAQALSCGDYVRQTWPQTGSKTLLAIKHALKTGSSYYQYSASHSIQLQLTDQGEPTKLVSEPHLNLLPLLVQIDGRPDDIVECIEQLAWFASSFRSPEKDSICLSQVEFRAVPTNFEDQPILIEVISCPLYKVREEELDLGSCWTMLYPSAVIAWGFPIAPRAEPVGLEIPWDLMLNFSGARIPTEFQDSIIIRQDPIIIYPSAKSDSGTHWHAVSGGLDAFFEQIKLIRLVPMKEDIQLVVRGRHFLGWLKNAQVNLGTQQPTDQTSGAEMDEGRGLQLGEEFSATLNIRLPWIASLTGGAKIITPRSQRQKIEGRQLDYELQIDRSSRTQAIYYDCRSKTAWLVPELSLLLHTAYAALLEHCADIDALYHLYYAHQEADGGRAAMQAIRTCEAISLWSTKEDDKEKDFRFKDLIKDFLVWFDNRKQAMGTRLEHRELLANLDLRGWDFGDLRDFTAIYRARKIAAPLLSGRPDWWELAKDPNTLVVFGNHAGQLISPSWRLERPCSSWESIPTSYNLLASTVNCLKDICRPWEDQLPEWRLSKRLAWHQPKDSKPFDYCVGNSCNPIQELRNRGILSSFRTLKNPTADQPDGAIIFGLPDQTLKHVKSRQKSQGHCQPLQRPDSNPSGRVYLRTRTRFENLRHRILKNFKFCLPLLQSHFFWYLVSIVVAVSAIVIRIERMVENYWEF